MIYSSLPSILVRRLPVAPGSTICFRAPSRCGDVGRAENALEVKTWCVVYSRPVDGLSQEDVVHVRRGALHQRGVHASMLHVKSIHKESHKNIMVKTASKDDLEVFDISPRIYDHVIAASKSIVNPRAIHQSSRDLPVSTANWPPF